MNVWPKTHWGICICYHPTLATELIKFLSVYLFIQLCGGGGRGKVRGLVYGCKGLRRWALRVSLMSNWLACQWTGQILTQASRNCSYDPLAINWVLSWFICFAWTSKSLPNSSCCTHTHTMGFSACGSQNGSGEACEARGLQLLSCIFKQRPMNSISVQLSLHSTASQPRQTTSRKSH